MQVAAFIPFGCFTSYKQHITRFSHLYKEDMEVRHIV